MLSRLASKEPKSSLRVPKASSAKSEKDGVERDSKADIQVEQDDDDSKWLKKAARSWQRDFSLPSTPYYARLPLPAPHQNLKTLSNSPSMAASRAAWSPQHWLLYWQTQEAARDGQKKAFREMQLAKQARKAEEEFAKQEQIHQQKLKQELEVHRDVLMGRLLKQPLTTQLIFKEVEAEFWQQRLEAREALRREAQAKRHAEAIKSFWQVRLEGRAALSLAMRKKQAKNAMVNRKLKEQLRKAMGRRALKEWKQKQQQQHLQWQQQQEKQKQQQQQQRSSINKPQRKKHQQERNQWQSQHQQNHAQYLKIQRKEQMGHGRKMGGKKHEKHQKGQKGQKGQGQKKNDWKTKAPRAAWTQAFSDAADYVSRRVASASEHASSWAKQTRERAAKHARTARYHAEQTKHKAMIKTLAAKRHAAKQFKEAREKADAWRETARIKATWHLEKARLAAEREAGKAHKFATSFFKR
eukprot:TRINITY_DN11743_c0_g1_i1.p1 TRINITY_DN11743_c0_g1~~TRINITY_DN11743_c0_g1_i1.p1  ORF type:complete len:468 (+),score=136.76 TRINITY_DN11743_c0_g1_i1:758-2161(+)